jgi:hypothetical protein
VSSERFSRLAELPGDAESLAIDYPGTFRRAF